MRRNEIQSIGDAIHEFLKKSGLEEQFLEARIINDWEDIIGSNVAKSTKQIYISNRTLHIRVNSSIVRAELFMIREGLVKAINDRAGKSIIDKIDLH
ncbi:MAG: DUF721 domain-containing protein [Bacteroidia bacterium]|nr:DUF721 domain-containing protein [Bacteroidia bacterium]